MKPQMYSLTHCGGKDPQIRDHCTKAPLINAHKYSDQEKLMATPLSYWILLVWTRKCIQCFVESMPPRILTVLRANKAPTESINLFPVVITLIFEQLELYDATLLAEFLEASNMYSCSGATEEARYQSVPYVSVFRGCLFFPKHGGCFFLGCT